MQRRPPHAELGQALPILVVALIGLLGFAALALDGGNLYTEHRRAQAAADNAVMAAAFGRMSGITNTVQLRTMALDNAALNRYDNNHTSNWVTFLLPPAHGPYAGQLGYMEVMITQTVPTALAHLVYRQTPIPVTVYAVAHGFPTGPMMPGYAIAALYPICGGSNALHIDGDGGGSYGGTYLFGAGAFINATTGGSPDCSDVADMAGSHQSLIVQGGGIDVVSNDPEAYTGEVCTDPNEANCNFYPQPTTGVPAMPQDPIAGTPAGEAPDCNDTALFPPRNLNAELTDADGSWIRPGSYDNLEPPGSFHDTMRLKPGMYCLTGDGTLSTGSGSVVGDGVFIHLRDPNTDIDVSGGATELIHLSAPTKESTGCTGSDDTSQPICAYLGILVHKLEGHNSCEQNDEEISFTGQARFELYGLIYAPKSLVRYGGDGSMLQVGQTLAGCVKFNGNGRIEIYYDPEVTYSPPPEVVLLE